jgi:thymidylate synthase ThyX
MKVTLIDYQKNALDLLLYTKNTRMTSGETLSDIANWPIDKKLDHLSYMRDTISSSWEFAHYIFEIEEVSRSFTHQLVRTRTASFAQQTQRVVDVRNVGYVANTSDIDYHDAVNDSLEAYGRMIDKGLQVQEARGVLPTCVHTNIIVGANLRTLSHMAELRLCKRTEGEYQNVFIEMVKEVIKVHPWAEKFLEVYCVKTGTCAFPRYKECPVQKYVPVVSPKAKEMIKNVWESTVHVANPVVRDGRTM